MREANSPDDQPKTLSQEALLNLAKDLITGVKNFDEVGSLTQTDESGLLNLLHIVSDIDPVFFEKHLIQIKNFIAKIAQLKPSLFATQHSPLKYSAAMGNSLLVQCFLDCFAESEIEGYNKNQDIFDVILFLIDIHLLEDALDLKVYLSIIEQLISEYPLINERTSYKGKFILEILMDAYIAEKSKNIKNPQLGSYYLRVAEVLLIHGADWSLQSANFDLVKKIEESELRNFLWLFQKYQPAQLKLENANPEDQLPETTPEVVPEITPQNQHAPLSLNQIQNLLLQQNININYLLNVLGSVDQDAFLRMANSLNNEDPSLLATTTYYILSFERALEDSLIFLLKSDLENIDEQNLNKILGTYLELTEVVVQKVWKVIEQKYKPLKTIPPLIRMDSDAYRQQREALEKLFSPAGNFKNRCLNLTANHRKIIVILANNLLFVESRCYFLEQLIKNLSPEQRAELSSVEINQQIYELHPQLGGIFMPQLDAKYQKRQRDKIKDIIANQWLPDQLPEDRDIDDILKELEGKRAQPEPKTADVKNRTSSAKKPKKPKKPKDQRSEIKEPETKEPEIKEPEIENPKIENPNNSPTQKKSKELGKKPPALPDQKAIKQPPILESKPLISALPTRSEILKQKALDALQRERDLLKTTFEKIKLDIEKASIEDRYGLENAQKNLQKRLGELRDEIKKQEQSFKIFFPAFEAAEKELLADLSRSTEDVRRCLDAIPFTELRISGSRVYHPILNSLPENPHLKILREPQDTDLCLVVDTMRQQDFHSDEAIRALISKNFVGYDLQQINLWPVDGIPKHSISIKIKHQETKQAFDINIYHPEHIEKLRQFHFGYNRLEVVLRGDDLELVDKESSDVDYFCWQIYQDSQKFWQPNPNATKFLPRLLGSGCIRPDESVIDNVIKQIDPKKLRKDFNDHLKNNYPDLSFADAQQKFIDDCQNDSYLAKLCTAITAAISPASAVKSTNPPSRLSAINQQNIPQTRGSI